VQNQKKFTLTAFYILSTIFFPNVSQATTEYEHCLLKSFALSIPGQTVEDIKAKCKEKGPVTPTEIKPADVVVTIPPAVDSDVEKRELVENIAEELPFLLVPNRSNYLLPITYNQSPNKEPFKGDNLKLDRAEVKFQFSVKSRIASDILGQNADLWLGYTNLSFWQAYNTNESSFFRETNHEPEIFMDFHPTLKLGDLKTNLIRIGASHQSNGLSSSRSRSWNRLYAMATVEMDDWYFSVKPWYRIPESRKDSPDDSHGDDNPDIDKFMGYGDLAAIYKLDDHTLGMTFRNNLRDRNRMGLQLDWTFPLKDKMRGYVQFYSGYGESLVDYNTTVNRIGLGIMFSDIL